MKLNLAAYLFLTFEISILGIIPNSFKNSSTLFETSSTVKNRLKII